MEYWTLNKINIDGYTVKVYVNKHNTLAVIFPLFGRYFRINSDSNNALDLAVGILFHTANNITYTGYLNSLDDTLEIELNKIA